MVAAAWAADFHADLFIRRKINKNKPQLHLTFVMWRIIFNLSVKKVFGLFFDNDTMFFIRRSVIDLHRG